MMVFFYMVIFIFDNLVASNRGFTRNPITVLFNSCIRARKMKQKLKIQQEKENAGLTENGDNQLGREDLEKDEQENDFDKHGIILKDISKSYKLKCRRKGFDSDWALRNVNINIKQGELFGLLGPNGAGKTTMIG